jgi:glutathione S-transferase
MAKPLLIIGNRNYSSWSLRPHMALAMAGVDFDTKLIRFGEPAFTKAVLQISKAGKVPILKHNDVAIWDSLAIIEYAAETWPKKNIWPANKKARARARCISAEMHSGFHALRNACPMNLRRPVKPITFLPAVLKDVARIEAIWSETRKEFGKGGPFLFGKFSAADAMFAPVASRLHIFAVPVKKETRAYMDAIFATPAFQDWLKLSAKEKWVVLEDEVD